MAGPGLKIPFDDSNLSKIGQYKAAMKAVDAELKAKSQEIDALVKKGKQVDKATQDSYDKLANLKQSYKDKADELKHQQEEAKETMHVLHGAEKVTKGITKIVGSNLFRKLANGEAIEAKDVIREAVQSEKLFKTIGKLGGADFVGKLAAAQPFVAAAAEAVIFATEKVQEQVEARQKAKEAGTAFGQGLMSEAEFERIQSSQDNTVKNVFGSLFINFEKKAIEQNQAIREGAKAFEELEGNPAAFGKMLREMEFGKQETGPGSFLNNIVSNIRGEDIAETLLGFKPSDVAAAFGYQTSDQGIRLIKPQLITIAVDDKLEEERRRRRLPSLNPEQRDKISRDVFERELRRQGVSDGNIVEFSKKLKEEAEKKQKDLEAKKMKRELGRDSTQLFKERQDEVILEVRRSEHYRRVSDTIPD